MSLNMSNDFLDGSSANTEAINTQEYVRMPDRLRKTFNFSDVLNKLNIVRRDLQKGLLGGEKKPEINEWEGICDFALEMSDRFRESMERFMDQQQHLTYEAS